jgi:5-formyltetrahydrofolate cyclo-ligase
MYSPLPDELDTGPLFKLAARHGCEIYLPRLHDYRARRMRFHPLTESMTPNRLGILEPDPTKTLGARWLDLVFVPLVGFDITGMRLGMGAGYYDRAFAYRRWRQTWRGPRLIGIAYAFQQLDHIVSAAHDVRLDAIVTDEGVLQCRTG